MITLDRKQMVANMTLFRCCPMFANETAPDHWLRAMHGMIHFATIVMLDTGNAATLEPVCLIDMMFVLDQLERSADPV